MFLEINPSGLWLFTEEPTGMPITDALVDLLIAYDEGDEPEGESESKAGSGPGPEPGDEPEPGDDE